MDLVELLKRPEGKTLAFKRDLSTPVGALKTIVSFVNTAGGALLVGVEDKSRHVRGVREPLDLEERLANLISDHILPRLVPELEILLWRRTQVLGVQVYPSPSRPHYLKREGPTAASTCGSAPPTGGPTASWSKNSVGSHGARPSTNSRCEGSTRKLWTSEPLPSRSRPCAGSAVPTSKPSASSPPTRGGRCPPWAAYCSSAWTVTTNLIESVMARLEAKTRRVTRWRTSDQKWRWCASAL